MHSETFERRERRFVKRSLRQCLKTALMKIFACPLSRCVSPSLDSR
jgi:hypothetical protein